MYQQTNSHRIHILPEHIIDQIKAGEVIERPSTLLKELLENSIDAKASKIEIEIINNGMDLLVVKDDGIGMPIEDMELAFLRHATSKIESFEDIYRLSSYGFRGEALASMASISKITCVSNEKDSPESTIKISGSVVESQHTEKKPLSNSK
jgi:DNA mismatch repair protein MutL